MKVFQYLVQKGRNYIDGGGNFIVSVSSSMQNRKGITIPPIKATRTVNLALTGFLFVFLSFASPSQMGREYNLKAKYLYNFTQFVEWPPEAFTSPGAPFVIGILGEDPFQSTIDDVVAGEKAKGHPIVVQRYAAVNEVKNCNILFINLSDTTRVSEILSALPSKNILTVSDLPNFATMGGIIGFYKEKGKIKLEINLPAAKNADINISSKLLQVAKIVR